MEAKNTENGVAKVMFVLWMTVTGGIFIEGVQSTEYVTFMDPLFMLAVFEGALLNW